MEYVTKEFCNERHGNTKDERATLKGRVTEHGKEIEALQKVADHQTSSIESITVRLENIDYLSLCTHAALCNHFYCYPCN